MILCPLFALEPQEELISRQIEFQSKNWSRVTNFGVLKVFLLLSINSNGSNLFQTSRVISIRKIFFPLSLPYALIPRTCSESPEHFSFSFLFNHNSLLLVFTELKQACRHWSKFKYPFTQLSSVHLANV